jgi:hypothetical protein
MPTIQSNKKHRCTRSKKRTPQPVQAIETPPGATPPQPAPRSALTPFEEMRLRRRLRRVACSGSWVDAQIVTLTDTTADGRSLVSAHFFDPAVYPPGGRKHTRMKWCRHCGRYTPPNCINLIEHRTHLAGEVTTATLRCDDCRIALEVRAHAELYAAFPHMRPASSLSFVKLRELLAQRREVREY